MFTGYQRLISDATGVVDTVTLEQIESIMRHDIFHSTLDWQTAVQLLKAAKQAYEMFKVMRDAAADLDPLVNEPGYREWTR